VGTGDLGTRDPGLSGTFVLLGKENFFIRVSWLLQNYGSLRIVKVGPLYHCALKRVKNYSAFEPEQVMATSLLPNKRQAGGV
jgi:hypothetical protein